MKYGLTVGISPRSSNSRRIIAAPWPHSFAVLSSWFSRLSSLIALESLCENWESSAGSVFFRIAAIPKPLFASSRLHRSVLSAALRRRFQSSCFLYEFSDLSSEHARAARATYFGSSKAKFVQRCARTESKTIGNPSISSSFAISLASPDQNAD